MDEVAQVNHESEITSNSASENLESPVAESPKAAVEVLDSSIEHSEVEPSFESSSTEEMDRTVETIVVERGEADPEYAPISKKDTSFEKSNNFQASEVLHAE